MKTAIITPDQKDVLLMKKWLMAAMVFLLALIAGEILLRIAYKIPPENNVADRNFTASPESLFANDSITGFGLRPGVTDVRKENGLLFTVSVDDDGYRTFAGKQDPATHIFLFGCSFFAGFGVNDTEVVSYYLQQMLPQHDVRNYSIPGHGTTTAFVKLKHLVKLGDVPEWVVVSLASFHIDRNFGANSYLKRFTVIDQFPRKFLVANFDEQGDLDFELKQVRDESLPLSDELAYMHLLNNAKEQRELSLELRLQLQLQLIDSIAIFCRNHGINELFTVITNDELSEKILQHLKERNYNWIRSEVNYRDEEYNLMPLDGHPNAKAHYVYAKEISDFIRDTVPLFEKTQKSP